MTNEEYNEEDLERMRKFKKFMRGRGFVLDPRGLAIAPGSSMRDHGPARQIRRGEMRCYKEWKPRSLPAMIRSP